MWLVTGGAGYIGSHVLLKMKEAGFALVTLDNLSSGLVKRIPSGVNLVEGDICDSDLVSRVLKENHIEGIINLAALKSVEESKRIPDEYERINHLGTKILVDCAIKAEVKIFIQSSTAAVYGNSESGFVSETSELNPISPYGQSKVLAENEVTRFIKEEGRRGTSLRYFNVAGALKAGRGWLAERHDPETHLIPNVLRSTVDNPVKIFGTDWPTADGTCIRDYVHVVDLIEAHLKALNSLGNPGHEIYNLGSGSGYSVREVVAAASAAIGHQIPFVDSPRRAGDPAVLIADISKAKSRLDWQPSRDLNAMVSDTLKSMG